jgi:hypothetical protein
MEWLHSLEMLFSFHLCIMHITYFGIIDREGMRQSCH